MNISSILLFILSSYFVFSKTEDEYKNEFKQFQKEKSKKYKSDNEKDARYKIFKQNYKKMEKLQSNPSLTYTLGVNSFFDLTEHEFQKNYLNLDIPFEDIMVTLGEDTESTEGARLLQTIPTSLDWRTKGAV